MKLRIYMMPVTTEALGPYRRCAFWVQGCTRRCPGCISPDAQSLDGGVLVEVEQLAQQISQLSSVEGITISGGEPFLQQSALCELIDLVRKRRDLGVIVYTGLLYSEIAESPLAQRCDLIIDGEYVEKLNDDRSLRGSSNQNIICISDRYRSVVDSYYGCPGRRIEFIQRNGRFDMVGIPSKSITYTFFGGK